MDDWAKKRLEKLQAAAPFGWKKADPFARIPLAWAALAAGATNSEGALVWIWLLHQVWYQKTGAITMPNGALAKLGVSRKVKNRVLLQLEKAGLVAVEWRCKKSPIVTLLHRNHA
jgi:hypothetical protein